MWLTVSYNMSVRKAFKALIMRDYDTTNITLIRQPRKQLVWIIVRLVGIENRTNLRAKQQSGKRHHYEESVGKATKKKLSVKGLGDDPYRNYLP